MTLCDQQYLEHDGEKTDFITLLVHILHVNIGPATRYCNTVYFFVTKPTNAASLKQGKSFPFTLLAFCPLVYFPSPHLLFLMQQLVQAVHESREAGLSLAESSLVRAC